MHEPLPVEIIAYAPTAFYHCTHCEVAFKEMGKSDRVHQEQLQSSLPDDLLEDYQAISDWVRQVFKTHCDRVVIKIIDAASLEGVIKALKYGARRYPAIIVAGDARFVGRQNMEAAAHEIDRRMQLVGLPA